LEARPEAETTVDGIGIKELRKIKDFSGMIKVHSNPGFCTFWTLAGTGWGRVQFFLAEPNGGLQAGDYEIPFDALLYARIYTEGKATASWRFEFVQKGKSH
jgi:hypothetical protein